MSAHVTACPHCPPYDSGLHMERFHLFHIRYGHAYRFGHPFDQQDWDDMVDDEEVWQWSQSDQEEGDTPVVVRHRRVTV